MPDTIRLFNYIQQFKATCSVF